MRTLGRGVVRHARLVTIALALVATALLTATPTAAAVEAPVITRVSRPSGPSGVSVTIRGRFFTTTSVVKFGSVTATASTIYPPNRIVVTVPPQALGTVDVSVTTEGGTSAPVATGRYTYTPPTVATLSRTSGPPGAVVAIRGNGLRDTTQVMFGDAPATSITVVSNVLVKAVAPRHAPGTVDVTVNTTFASSAPTPASRYAFVFAFNDEFDGGALDLSKWEPNWFGATSTTITTPPNDGEDGCIDPSLASVSGGSLHLDVTKRTCTTSNGRTYEYASSLVSTRSHFTFAQGHMEARIWLPGTTNVTNWPAFWATGTRTWPRTGELDVMEGLEGDTCYHFHSRVSVQGGCAEPRAPGWHTYAADWSASRVTFTYDGVVVGTITSGITTAPMFVILNFAVSSQYAPPIVAPSGMLVDYVRVWK